MKTAILCLCFLCLSIANMANAASMQCVGMTNSGLVVNVLIDSDSATLNVNENILKITNMTNDSNGFSTENFINKNGEYVYFSIEKINDSKFLLIQFNAATNNIVLYVSLACHLL